MSEPEPTQGKETASAEQGIFPPLGEKSRNGTEHSRPRLDENAEKCQAAFPEPEPARRTRAVSRQPVGLPFRLSISLGGQQHELSLLDISNHGLRVLLPSNVDMEHGLPGRRMSGVSITLSGQEVLGGVQAIVRRTSVSESSEGGSGFEIGLELIAERRSRLAKDLPTELKNPARIAEVVQGGLRSGVSVTVLDGTFEPVRYTHGKVDRDGGVLRLHGENAFEITTGDAVRVTCEAGGFSCSFFSSVVVEAGQSTISLRLPRLVKMRRSRNLHRLQPDPNRQVEIELKSPFDRRPFRTAVLDVNNSGASFTAGRDTTVLPVGTIIEPLKLTFPNSRIFVVRGRVRSLTPMPDQNGESRIRYGIEFEALSDETKEIIADEAVRSVRPSLFSTTGVTFEDLWSFFEQSGFLYPEKLEELAHQLPKIQETYSHLLDQRQTKVLKTYVWKRDGAILGHVSTLRLYRNTSYIQHIAVIRQAQSLFATEALSLGTSEYLEQIPQLEWCRMYFRPNNRWPARVFGTFAKKLNEPLLSDIRTVAYCVGSTTAEAITLPSGTRIAPAQRVHLEEIQRYFLSRGRVIALQSDDLSLDHLSMKEVEHLYSENGLQRRREILAFENGSSFAGFALLEISSPGLNLSELTNHFSVHVMEGGSTTRRMLIAAARDRYRELGRKTCIALNDGEGLEDYDAMGLPKHKDYLCWTGHRSLLRSYSEYVLRMFGRYADA